jgi:insulysin
MAQSPVERLADRLEKPVIDNRSYRVIRLSNKLEAFLVHDPDTDKASASMNVGVGNFSDPDDLFGLAHCLEHLLFMGTEKVCRTATEHSLYSSFCFYEIFQLTRTI